MSITEEKNERIEIKAKPLDLSGYAKSKEQKLISHWTNQLISLIFSDKISTINRPIFLLRHLNSSSRNTLAVNRCPNVSYVPDPFQADTIQSIFNQLKNPSFLTWEHILECLKLGSFNNIIKKEKEFDEVDLASIESFFLVLLYFRCFAHQDMNYQLEEPFSEILQLILKKELKIIQKTSLSNNFWEIVFKRKNLRFESYATGNSPKYCPSNVYFNEILDCIRLRNQNQSKFIKVIDLNKDDHSRMELEQLCSILQCSFYTFLEFSLFSEYLTIENIKVLSKYAKNLPPSWFTPDFLQATLNLAKHEMEKPVNKSCLKEILEIYVWWAKKNSSFLSMTLATDIIEFVFEIASLPDLICHTTLIICSAADKLSVEYLLRLSNMLAELLSNDNNKQLWKDSKKIGSITPGLAHLMKIIPYPGVISTTLINSWNLSKENYKLLHIYHLILEEKLQEAGLVGVGVIKKKKKNNINNGWLHEIIKSCDNKEKPVQSLYAMAGVLKGFHPYTTDNSLKSNESSLVFDNMTKIFLQMIQVLLDKLEEIPGAKECISYCFSECFNIIELDHKTFSKLFIDERLLKALFDNLINELRLEWNFFDNMYKESITKNDSYQQAFSKKLESPLFISFKQSWAFSVILWNQIDQIENHYNLKRRSIGEKRILNIYEGFTHFVKELYIKWKDCKLNDDNIKTTNDKPIKLILWYFRDLLLIYTMITNYLYTDYYSHTPNMYDEDNNLKKKKKIDFRTCMILNSLNTFSYLHFVTISFGEDGFDLWRIVIEKIISQIEQLKPNGLIEDIISQFKVKDININSSSMEKCRFIFFLYVSKKLISHLSSHFVHQFMYRPITQFLSIQVTDANNNSNNINYDLFNSSHKICLSIFENPKNFKQLILSIADNYSNLLIHVNYNITIIRYFENNYPNKIDFLRIRQGYFSLIRGLTLSISFNNSESLFTGNEEEDIMVSDKQIKQEQNNENSSFVNNLNSEEWDIVALRCLLKLTNKIYKYSELITSSSSNITDTGNTKNNTYKAQLIIERGHFITILFDQIHCVSIPVMEILLEIIKQIVLNNCIILDFSCKNNHTIHHRNKKLNDDDQCDIEDEYENKDEEEKINDQENNKKENSILRSSKKITLCEDLVPLNSQLWKSLYNTVSSTRLDRRKTERCVLWYLSLQYTKKNNYKELNNDDELKSKKSSNIDNNSKDSENEDDQEHSILTSKSKL